MNIALPLPTNIGILASFIHAMFGLVYARCPAAEGFSMPVYRGGGWGGEPLSFIKMSLILDLSNTNQLEKELGREIC